MKRSSVAVSLSVAMLVIAACSTQQEQQPENPPPSRPMAQVESALPEAADEMSDQAATAAVAIRSKHERKEADLAQGAGHANGAVSKLMAMEAPAAAPPSAYCCFQPQPLPQDTEKYGRIDSNPVQRVAENPVSTFSIDVDTGSYANVRRFLKEGRLPPSDAVRVEELINYFDYAYAPPRDAGTPFSVSTEIAAAPWNAKTQLLRVGIQGWKPQGPRKASNLVFLVDVSGSMNEPNKLPLVKSSLKLLTRQLSHDDRISLVVYAGNSGVVLEPTPGDQGAKIESALDRLEAGGSTNGGEGILSAYAMAQQAFIKGGNNRVLLATDGDFNVGVTRFESLLDLVKDQRKGGIALTTLGFGTGNYNDNLMEQLADAGDGNYAYVDSLTEAQKVLVDQRDATLTTIARDVKIQIEFNPAVVSDYRLIGYENRMLKREDFNNDKVDAGDIGAGHTVTALYEIALAGSGGARVEPLRYGKLESGLEIRDGELAWVRLRYKAPQEGFESASKLIGRPVYSRAIESPERMSDSFRLAAAVAAFGQLLRGGKYTEGFHYTDVEKLARGARGDDRNGYAGEFLQLVKLADSLSAQQARSGEN